MATVTDARELAERLRQVHPLQYGFRNGHAVIEYEPDDKTVVERFNRCPHCEEWSPCSGRQAADELERLSALLDATNLEGS